MNLQIATSLATAYSGRAAIRVVDWVRFQASSTRLMKIFWADNNATELREAYDFLLSRRVPLHGLRSAIAGRGGTGLLEASRVDLARRGLTLDHDWTDEALTIGFLGHHYVKAFRYAVNLQERYTYAVHFTREPALGLAPTPSLTSETVRGLFPWGDLIMPVSFEERRLVNEGFGDIVKGLCDYTEVKGRNFFSLLAEIRKASEIPHERCKNAIKQGRALTREFSIARSHGGLRQAIESARRRVVESG